MRRPRSHLARPRVAPKVVVPADMTVGSDGWKTFVADAVGVAPSRRTKAMKVAIDQAMRGDDDLPAHLHDEAARLADLEGRLSWDDDGPSCRLTATDWRLFVLSNPKSSLTAARDLNAAVEEALREGRDPQEAVRETGAGYVGEGALHEDVATVASHVAETLGGMRPSTGPGMR